MVTQESVQSSTFSSETQAVGLAAASRAVNVAKIVTHTPLARLRPLGSAGGRDRGCAERALGISLEWTGALEKVASFRWLGRDEAQARAS
jgi:hypothetical protein